MGRRAESSTDAPDISGLSDYAEAFSIPREQQLQEQQLEQEREEWDLQRKNAQLGGDEQPVPDLGQDEFPEEFWATDKERVYLVGVSEKKRTNGGGYTIDESLEELGRLSETAGLKVVGQTYQFLDPPNPATYIGGGKLAEIAQAVQAFNVDTIIFDDELSPGQMRNIEKVFAAGPAGAVKVADRTALILDIFSQRAQTREGQLQVELAMTQYQLPRLTRMWSHLDRVGGGGQVKGSGEKQIETDKRILRDRMGDLKKKLEAVRTHRRHYRERRQSTPIPVIAIVGYTNAGKSTLLNTLTRAGVLAEDKLFATLDPTTRKVRLAGNKQVLVSDTVGFIQKLPTQLVAAFRATLEEIQDASLILHIVDISHPNADGQSGAVMKVLDELEVGHIPIITAWNKLDACQDPDQVRSLAGGSSSDTVALSGQSGEGVQALLALIASKLEEAMVEVEVLLPYAAGDILDNLHTCGIIRATEYRSEGTLVAASVPPSMLGRLARYSTRVLTDGAAASSLPSGDDGVDDEEERGRSRLGVVLDAEGLGEVEGSEGSEDEWAQMLSESEGGSCRGRGRARRCSLESAGLLASGVSFASGCAAAA
ncbi:MAG: hypothetical protein WDW36_003265 [Sanguina aurantia]